MFKKLVSNLPFNPSLIGQVAFYSTRLKQERAMRSLGLFFIVATMIVQMFAVISPPERSLAASNNHIINGLRTKDDILRAWDAAGSDVPAIYGAFGLTREDIASLPANPNTTVFSGDGNDWWTIGRTSLTGYANVDQRYKNSQIAIQYSGQNTSTTSDDRFVYHRQLRAWDIVNRSGNYYKAFKGTIKSTGETFWILVDCGNFTKIGRYTPPPPPPPPPPKNPLSAVCSMNGPIIIKQDQEEVSIPVRIILPEGKSIPAGSTSADGGSGKGLHLGVSTKGAPATWNVHDNTVLAREPLTPPDKQSDYRPTPNNLSNLTYYEFRWDYDGEMYRRYFVSSAQNNSFDVRLNVRINANDKTLVIRLLDRDLGQWLPHSSSCEVGIGRESPPPPDPKLEIKKTILNKRAVYKPGDTYSYLIQYRNTVNASLAENVVITDELDTRHFDVVQLTPSTARVTNGFLSFKAGSVPYSTTYKQIEVKVRLKDQISSGTTVCNAARITADNASAVSTPPICIGVITPCPYDDSVPDINNPNCTEPKVVCELLDANVNLTTRRVTFRTTASSSNPANTTISAFKYDFGDGTELVVDSDQFVNETAHTYAPGDFTASVIVAYGARGVNETQQTDECSVPISFEAERAVGQFKTVRNITQDKEGEAAESSSLRPGDVLEFTLKTTNANNYPRTAIEVADDIADVLDYSDLNLEFLKEQGGTYDDQSKKLVWSDVTIPANGEVLHSFRVKIKDPIPSTNAPSNVSTTFDCKISNMYGQEISINVDCPLVKGVETLPNTGPGSSIVMLSLITVFIGYFFARNRLLAKELDLVRSDYAMTGGM